MIPWSAPGAPTVCAYGINIGAPTVNSQIGCRVLNIGAAFGSLDAVTFGPGGIRVAGWAIDPDTANPIVVHVYVGSAGFNIGVANTSRPDVGSAYPGYGSNHGYDTAIPWASPGPVTVCAYAIDATGASPNQLMGCR